MKKLSLLFLLITILITGLITWATIQDHQGIISTKGLRTSVENMDVNSIATWIPKSEIGINQLILKGPPLERGYAAGKLTQKILYAQEKSLVTIFDAFLPNPVLRRAFIIGLTWWFSGIENYFEPETLEEMYGVSLSTSPEFNRLADPFTRQVAYHGLHEVGQMLIDNQVDVMGCTLFALPYKNSWVIGRNFDFEAGRIFDEEKIMKWVFPEHGNAFVSVTWAGMVGVVTGVNEQGVYISLNAAGSDDFKRLGTPSTLVILKALMFANTADQARKIIEAAPMFITDIFVVVDKTGQAYRIEKSPKKFVSIPLHEASVITNHLIGKIWAFDKTNEQRKKKNTTLFRAERGEVLLRENKNNKTDNHRLLLSFLRDKQDENAHSLSHSIDSRVTSHSVIYDAPQNLLYVSQGPGLAGKFFGFNLKKSFQEMKPVAADVLAAEEHP